jgi:hypothetical protein
LGEGERKQVTGEGERKQVTGEGEKTSDMGGREKTGDRAVGGEISDMPAARFCNLVFSAANLRMRSA